jgi:hypothetical protein
MMIFIDVASVACLREVWQRTEEKRRADTSVACVREVWLRGVACLGEVW